MVGLKRGRSLRKTAQPSVQTPTPTPVPLDLGPFLWLKRQAIRHRLQGPILDKTGSHHLRSNSIHTCRVETCSVETCSVETCRVETCRVETCRVETCSVEDKGKSKISEAAAAATTRVATITTAVAGSLVVIMGLTKVPIDEGGRSRVNSSSINSSISSHDTISSSTSNRNTISSSIDSSSHISSSTSNHNTISSSSSSSSNTISNHHDWVLPTVVIVVATLGVDPAVMMIIKVIVMAIPGIILGTGTHNTPPLATDRTNRTPRGRVLALDAGLIQIQLTRLTERLVMFTAPHIPLLT